MHTIRQMPSPELQLFDNASQVQNQTLVTTTETLVLANAIALVGLSNGIVFGGAIYLIPGVGTTGLIVRFRRGYGVSGVIDWEPAGYGPPGGLYAVPGVVNAVPLNGLFSADWYQQPGGGQYSVTVEQVNAKANGSVLSASVAFSNVVFWDTEA